MFMPTLKASRSELADRLAVEDEDDQALLRPRSARGRREERRERVDDQGEQRVVDRGVHLEGQQEVVDGRHPEHPRERLRHDDAGDEPARVVDDREAAHHALARVRRRAR